MSYLYVGLCVFIYRAIFQDKKKEGSIIYLPMSVAKKTCGTQCFCRPITTRQ